MKRVITNWTPEQDAFLLANYVTMGNKEMVRRMGLPERAIVYRAHHFGLKKSWKTKSIVSGKIELTAQREQYIRDHYDTLTNQQIADALGLKLSITRYFIYALCLQRFPMQYWTQEQVQYVTAHYKTMGDVELAEGLQELWPREKVWTKKHVCKKRGYLKLVRTPAEIRAIMQVNAAEGGPCHTMPANSSQHNLQDGFVASMIAWRDKDLKKEVLKHPELIELKRQEILLTRQIRRAKHGT